MRLLSKKKKEKKAPIIQENQEECVRLIKESFLSKYLTNTTTDISFNGNDFYILDNELGRYKIDCALDSNEVYSLMKKIANYMLKPFSIKSPILDVAFDDYRLNATHPLIARSNNKKVCTFSLRLIYPTLRIKRDDEVLAPKCVHTLLECLVKSYQSILISGQTGSGKTELQKYLISFMNKKDRLIVIEDSYETHLKEIYKDMDITSWIAGNEITNNTQALVKLSLRNNPDWTIIAETRDGIVAYDMVQAIMTGHSAITTIHSESSEFSLKRITQMAKRSIDFDEKMLLNTMAKHIKIGIHMEKLFDSKNERYIRRIESICEYIPTEDGYTSNYLYIIKKDTNLVETIHYGFISKKLIEKLVKYDINLSTISTFIGDNYEEKL